ncbi:MAG TPA: VTT domain-containing protein [Thermoanaerobaculia bacterium]|nr:VTT domain-containing protein [Thermoanaerobaculia bacterium]
MTRRTTLRVVGGLVAILVLVIAARTLPIAAWLEQFKDYVQGIGPAGWVLYVIVYAICCVLLIPASALTLGAGAIFGFATGSIIVLIGATLGAAAAFLLARTILRRRVEAMAVSSPRLAAVDRAIAAEGTKVMFLMRLSGFPPFTWINYALGVTGVGFGPYVITTVVGIIPGVIAFTWAGAAGAAALTGSGNRLTLIVTAVGAIVVSAYIARIATRAIRRAGVAP